MTETTRPGWSGVWARMALTMAERSRCVRSQIGAVIVSDENRIVATGYNGPPATWPSVGRCDGWCDRARNPLNLSPDYSDCPSNHAEINALMHSSRSDRIGGYIYVTGSVCFACAKAIANSGLRHVRLVNVAPEDEQHREPDRVNSFLRMCGLDVVYVDVNPR